MGDCNCKGGSHGGTATMCVECDIPQLARNCYFTGKLLVERDFTDEQHYFMGKERRHNQRLHGWGAVCGLKVSPHPNPACADRFVLIDPGTAIDCCGREILVRDQECFDFKSKLLDNWQMQNGPGTSPSSDAMDIQICIFYKECATEDVPALFDDCSSDSSSRPNRILESYGFDVLIKPKSSVPEVGGIGLKWCCTLNFADAVRVVRDDGTKRIYVLTSTPTTAVLYALDSGTGSVVMPPQTFNAAAGLDLAVSPAGDFIYVATQPSAAGAAPQIAVCKSTDLSLANTVNIGAASDSQVRIAVVPDGRVISIGQVSGVLVWDASINSSSTATGTPVAGIAKPVDIAVSPGGSYAYVTSTGTNNVSAISLTVAALPVTTFPVGAAPTMLSAATTTAGDMLAVVDLSGTPTLFFVGLGAGPGSPKALGNTAGFANPPVDVRLSPGGRWALILEQDSSGKVFVQPADEHAVETGAGTVLGTALSVGAGPASEFLSADGRRLYVPYKGTQALPGAIAIVDIEQANCGDLFKQAIEPCPDCDDGNCIVLATITGYVFGNPVTAAQVDNLTDRHILASTSLLTGAVRCLLDCGSGTGTAGAQGPPGPPGQPGTDGLGIDKVAVTFVPCDTPGSATITGNSPNRTLTLTIPGECNTDLTGISSVSWKQNGGTLKVGDLNDGIFMKVAFSAPVQAADLTVDSIAVWIPVQNNALTLWAEGTIHIEGGNFATLGDALSTFTVSTAAQVNGVRIIPDSKTMQQLIELKSPKLRVVVKGDFIRDATSQQRAIDGDHLPPWLPAQRTGDGIEGGTFESWILIQYPQG